jgi:gluconolactonase
MLPRQNSSRQSMYIMLRSYPIVLFQLFLISINSFSCAQNVSFQSLSPSFAQILGPSPDITLLYESSLPLFHESAIYYPPTESLFVSSNQIVASSPSTGNKSIIISRVTGLHSASDTQLELISAPGVVLANGAAIFLNAPAKSGPNLVWCSQGDLTNAASGGIVAMSATSPYNTTSLVTSFHGKPFNSPNDVIIAEDGSLYFTDPPYGYQQGVRHTPELPSHVYRYVPATGGIRAMADDLVRPNGLAFSPDESVLYVTDTGSILGNGATDLTGPASVYAFDVHTASGSPFLTNRRLFAYVDAGIPDGIKVDTMGNVYAGCGDGVHVWSPGGDLAGKILVQGGVANFGFGEAGVMFLLNEKRLYRADLSKEVMTAVQRM